MRLPAGEKLDLGDTYHGAFSKLGKDWVSIALDSDARTYVNAEPDIPPEIVQLPIARQYLGSPIWFQMRST